MLKGFKQFLMHGNVIRPRRSGRHRCCFWSRGHGPREGSDYAIDRGDRGKAGFLGDRL